MGHSYKRSRRVGEQILKETSSMIINGEVNDPRIQSVVLTGFHLSDDMGYLKLYYTNLTESADVEEIQKGLNGATGFIRKKIAGKLSLKKFPKIEFEYDKVLEKGYKVDDLIKEYVGERN